MNKRAGLTKNIKGITFVELLISLIVVSIMVLSFYSLETYGHRQVMIADRRVKVQNDLAYALEHMAKYVQQASGNLSKKAIQYYPNPANAATATGFRVYVDLNSTQTPSVFTDDGWIDYDLFNSNTLRATCTANGGTCPFTSPEYLSYKIISGVVGNTTMPVSPTNGFYVLVGSLGNFVDVGLVGLYDPNKPISNTGVNPVTRKTEFVNPQVAMKTKIICNSSSSN